MKLFKKLLMFAACLSGLLGGMAQGAEPVSLTFYYPVAVGGAITKLIDGMTADFEKSHPGITVHAVYAGTYQDCLVKSMTAYKSGNPPQVAVLLSADMHSLVDEGAIEPLDTLATSPADHQWLRSFYPGLMLNSQSEGKTWGAPFMRSTIVLFWNKALFKQAGLDPDHAPATLTEMTSMAKKLTKVDARGQTTQWGVEIPSTSFPYWLFQGLAVAYDAILMNPAGTETYFDQPGAIKALQYWADLSARDKVMPKGTIEWGTTPEDFLQQKTAMMWTTTGNLSNIRANAHFPFGVAMLPGNKRHGSPTGGGNFYVFKKSTPAQQQAALKFIQWMTSPERSAQWSIATGYLAVTPAAWETPAMKQYVAKVPAALVARDQLKFAVAELSTHDNQHVTKVLNDSLQAALTGSKPVAQALHDAQQEAARILH